jgi:hypothetical protein
VTLTWTELTFCMMICHVSDGPLTTPTTAHADRSANMMKNNALDPAALIILSRLLGLGFEETFEGDDPSYDCIFSTFLVVKGRSSSSRLLTNILRRRGGVYWPCLW